MSTISSQSMHSGSVPPNSIRPSVAASFVPNVNKTPNNLPLERNRGQKKYRTRIINHDTSNITIDPTRYLYGGTVEPKNRRKKLLRKRYFSEIDDSCEVTRFGPKIGQIGSKWDKSGTFSHQISVHFGQNLLNRAKMYINLILPTLSQNVL